jgi:hypothetical protein
MSIAGLLGGGARDPGVSKINAKKHQWWATWKVPELKIRQCPPSMLRNIDGGPWDAVLEIRELPPSMLKNIDGGPLGPYEQGVQDLKGVL